MEEAADASANALDLWRAVGDRRREGDSTRRLSCILCHLCRGPEAEAAAETAVAVLETLPAGIELAQAYANLATLRMVRGRHREAIEHARRAQAIAGPASALAVVSDALNTEATSTADLGGEWTGLMDRALRIALAGGLHAEAGRAYCNFCAIYYDQRLFADAEPPPVTRLCPLNRIGAILARRGDRGVWACLDEAMTAADRTGEPQQIVPVRLSRAEAYWLEGRTAEAALEAQRADDAADMWWNGAVAVWLQRTGSARTPCGELAEPYQHQVNGHWEKAAQLWTRLELPVRGRADPAGRCRRRARCGRRSAPSPASARPPRPGWPGRSCVRSASGRSRSVPGPRPEEIRSGSPGASARSSRRSAPGRPTRRSPRSCSSRPRPSITTSPPCWPSSARRTATPPRPRRPGSA